MKKIGIGCLALIFSIIAASPGPAQLKKIHFSTSSIAITELQFRIAQVKGFYRDEGLDLETILIRGAVGIQALLGGSVDYSSAAGALIAGAVRGLPVRLVLIVNAKPQFDLVGAPEIKSVQQLRGNPISPESKDRAQSLALELVKESGIRWISAAEFMRVTRSTERGVTYPIDVRSQSEYESGHI